MSSTATARCCSRPFVNVRCSTITDFASESSPVVADINGDGLPRHRSCGDENAVLNGDLAATGRMLPGFPIQLGGEVRGSAGRATATMTA